MRLLKSAGKPLRKTIDMMSKANFRIVTRLLAVGAMCLIFRYDRTTNADTKDIMMYLTFAMIFAIAFMYILYFVKPNLFRDKSDYRKN